jgi:hypothetical protein
VLKLGLGVGLGFGSGSVLGLGLGSGFADLGHDVLAQLHDDPPRGLTADSHVEEDLVRSVSGEAVR